MFHQQALENITVNWVAFALKNTTSPVSMQIATTPEIAPSFDLTKSSANHSSKKLVLASMFIEASAGGISMLKFWSASSMMIVLGGTVAATAVAFRLNEVTRVLGIIKFAFTKPKFQLQELVQALIDLAEINRKGPSELEKEIPNIKHLFLQDSVTFVTQGMKLDDLREILEQTSRKALLEADKDEAEFLQEKLQKVPYPIYIG